MASRLGTEIETRKLRLADARLALDVAHRRLTERHRDVAVLREALNEAKAGLVALEAADAVLDRHLGRKE